MKSNSYYQSREVAEIVRMPVRTLRYWATSKIITPAKDAVGRPGIRREYSFRNLVECFLLWDLHGLNLSSNRMSRAIKELNEKRPGWQEIGLRNEPNPEYVEVCWLAIQCFPFYKRRVEIEVYHNLKCFNIAFWNFREVVLLVPIHEIGARAARSTMYGKKGLRGLLI